MAKVPDHMKGIDALPKWDAANPTKYNYDPQNYDPNDYAQFKAARIAHSAKQQKAATSKLKQTMKEASNAITDTAKGEAKKQGGPNRDEINKAVKAGRTLVATMPSTCLASLTFRQGKNQDGDGIATAEFYRGGAVVYDFDMSLDDFLDWSSSSLGEWGNAYVFE